MPGSRPGDAAKFSMTIGAPWADANGASGVACAAMVSVVSGSWANGARPSARPSAKVAA